MSMSSKAKHNLLACAKLPRIGISALLGVTKIRDDRSMVNQSLPKLRPSALGQLAADD
jgi:hypothetical protein